MANTQQFNLDRAVEAVLAAVKVKVEAEAAGLSREKRRALNPKEAAAFLGVSAITLSIWRCRKRYALPYMRIGNRIFYELQDLQNFKKRRKVYPRASRRARAAA